MQAARRDNRVADAGPAGGDAVDFGHLARQTFGSRDLQVEVLGLFLDQSIALLDRMRTGADPVQRFRAAHTIKGSARGIGAWRVARLAEAVENADKMPGDAARMLAELAAAIDEANGAIRRHLGR